MDNLPNALSTITGLAVTIFVSITVWLTLIAGLYQLVRDEIRQVQMMPRRLAPKTPAAPFISRKTARTGF